MVSAMKWEACQGMERHGKDFQYRRADVRKANHWIHLTYITHNLRSYRCSKPYAVSHVVHDAESINCRAFEGSSETFESYATLQTSLFSRAFSFWVHSRGNCTLQRKKLYGLKSRGFFHTEWAMYLSIEAISRFDIRLKIFPVHDQFSQAAYRENGISSPQ